MTDRGYLGEVELMILLAIVHPGNQTYRVPIARELERRGGCEIPLASVFAARERLESKDLVASRLGIRAPHPSAKPKGPSESAGRACAR
jgi:PadR family transcriptional regulator, regulatory protein PadR